MIAKSFYLFLFVFIYYNNEIFGQDYLSIQDNYCNATIMSPQSYTFTQYGNHTPELAREEDVNDVFCLIPSECVCNLSRCLNVVYLERC